MQSERVIREGRVREEGMVMNFMSKEMLIKIKSLPIEKREKVINGLVKMLALRPKDPVTKLHNVESSNSDRNFTNLEEDLGS